MCLCLLAAVGTCSYQLPAKRSCGFGTKIEEGKKLSVDAPKQAANHTRYIPLVFTDDGPRHNHHSFSATV